MAEIKETGYLGFRVPREYYDAFKVYRIAYNKRIIEKYGDADINSAFLYLFSEFCEQEKLDLCLKLINEYEDARFNVKRELRKIALETEGE